jgi:CLIP-associating protein 1/2
VTANAGNRRRYGRPYGYRAPGSDYGDHTRRVNGAWGADSGDDASETSSICSERSLEDVADIVRRMQSNEWTERKDSLASLYHMIRSGRVFSTHELKRLTELLTKRFYDPHSQVFTAFLDVLPEFITAYKRELNEWLYALLTRLLIRLGAPDLLDSVYKKLKTCLSIVNTSFDVHAQFTVLIRFINDNSSAPSIKAKEILLRYLQQIIQTMEPVDIANNADIRIALSKIINWSNEPKSIEMRKAAQGVILALYNLNRPEFTLMLTALPPTYQDAAAKILRPTNDTHASIHDNKLDFLQRSNNTGLTSSIHSDVPTLSYASDMRVLMENMQALNINHRQDDLLLSNSNPLKDSGYQDFRTNSSRHYTPQAYRSNQSQSNATETSDSILDATDRPAAIDIALNMANQQTLGKEQRQHALRCILKFSKLNDNETWTLAFSKTLNMLTQILDNDHDEILYKVYSLRIIRELLTHHTNLFLNYVELTIFRILKAQGETESELIRSAEQAAHAAAEYLPAENTVRVLKPIIEQAKYPMNQSAIAMLQKTIELMNKETCTELMPEMIPPLLTSWDSETSSVRKAAVFCLVSIYLVVGDSLRLHLHKLSASKLKLLNVYISKAQQQTSNTSNLEKSSTLHGNSNKIS